jgi:hypothetical protein
MKLVPILCIGILLALPRLAAGANRVVAEEVVPKELVRGFFPQDGEVLTHVIKKDVWAQNKDPFERHETLELSFGRAIRARADDRKNEQSMSPGIQFEDGRFLLQGGWRLHKQVPKHPDYFDGTFRAQVVPVIVGGQTYFHATVDLTWRRSFLSKIVPVVGDVVAAVVRSKAEEAARKAIEKDLPPKIDEAARKALVRVGLDPSLRDRVVVDVAEAGLRVRVLEAKAEVVRVSVGQLEFRPPDTGKAAGADADFGGHGPSVRVAAEVTSTDREARFTLSMKARETKKDWTEASGSTSKVFYTAPQGRKILALVGATRWSPLVDGEIEGHDPTEIDTLLGRLTIWGDRDGKDAGVYTGVKLSSDYLVTVLLD